MSKSLSAAFGFIAAVYFTSKQVKSIGGVLFVIWVIVCSVLVKLAPNHVR